MLAPQSLSPNPLLISLGGLNVLLQIRFICFEMMMVPTVKNRGGSRGKRAQWHWYIIAEYSCS